MPMPAPHVLIMDDSPAICELLQEVLHEEGYRVTTATTLLDVAQIAALAPDCILLEWRFGQCPDAGRRHVQRLRLEPALAWTPIVLCTTADRHLTDPQIAQMLKHLHVAVVRKPCALEELLDILQRARRAPSAQLLAHADWVSQLDRGSDRSSGSVSASVDAEHGFVSLPGQQK
jgi:CheY-like chemotaxis protein